MAEDIWRVHISDNVNVKINNAAHRLTREDVRFACGNRTLARWIHDEERGWRLYVEGRTERGAPVIAVLYPTAEHGLWNLGTARRT